MKGKREIGAKWHALADEILKLVVEKGMVDAEIATIYKTSITTIYSIRKIYNIPANRRRKRKPKPAAPPKVKKIKRNGQTITICPPRYAANVYVTNWVRPTGKR